MAGQALPSKKNVINRYNKLLLMVYTYLLKSLKDGSYYVGISKNPKNRLIFHNAGDNISTSRKNPWVLVYVKLHASYVEARKHEKWLKKKNKEYKNKLESFGGDLSRLG